MRCLRLNWAGWSAVVCLWLLSTLMDMAKAVPSTLLGESLNFFLGIVLRTLIVLNITEDFDVSVRNSLTLFLSWFYSSSNPLTRKSKSRSEPEITVAIETGQELTGVTRISGLSGFFWLFIFHLCSRSITRKQHSKSETPPWEPFMYASFL